MAVTLSPDTGEYRRLYDRGRKLGREASAAYFAEEYANAARLARECAQVAAVLGHDSDVEHWTRNAELAEAKV